MRIVFCSDPLSITRPDEAYATEVAAAEALGIPYDLIHFEALVYEDDPVRAVRRVPEQLHPQTALYRGWMLTPEQYARLYDALVARGVRLINDPAAYRSCHALPEWYAAVAPATPQSVWLETAGEPSAEQLRGLTQSFGAGPIVVKDFVKSRKHEWTEACFIPSAADLPTVERVVRRFVELQGDDLYGGIVLREFIDFQPLTTHSRSGMPLTREYRMFVFDGVPVYTIEYWEEGDYGDVTPPTDQFASIAAAVPSRFFTIDLAQRLDGEWMVVELGDGQVAGLPERANAALFLGATLERWPT